MGSPGHGQVPACKSSCPGSCCAPVGAEWSRHSVVCVWRERICLAGGHIRLPCREFGGRLLAGLLHWFGSPRVFLQLAGQKFASR